MSRVIRNTPEGREDSRLDKFYDETPQVQLTYQLRVVGRPTVFELYYNVRLDGNEEENKQIIADIEPRAQADMFNILLRLQAQDEDVEFSSWTLLDQQGVILKTSDTLTITVK